MALAFSKNNHLNYGYTENFLSDHPNSVFYLGLGAIENRPLKSFAEECQLAAQDIYQRSDGRKIYVTLSGGVDSECVLRSFVNAKVPFEAAIMQFDDDMNWHDVRPAVQLCESLNVTYTILNLNVFDFLDSGLHLKYAKDFKLASPMIATHVWLAEKILKDLQGLPVFSGDFVRLALPSNENIRKAAPVLESHNGWVTLPDYWNFNAFGNQDHFALDRLFHAYANDLQLPGVANFFFYSAEQVAASVALGLSHKYWHFENQLMAAYRHVVQKSPDHFYQTQIRLNSCKEHFYTLSGFNVNKRFSKWTGFELIHQSMVLKSKTDKHLDPNSNYDEGIQGMTLFNEKFRSPMQAIASQSFLRKVILHPSLFSAISLALYKT